MISFHEETKDPKKLRNGWHTLIPRGWDGKFAEGEFEGVLCRRSWCPALFKGGVRLKENFLASCVVGLDFDEGRTLAWAIETFKDFDCIIATTKSHQKIKGEKPACDRFRVILFLSEGIFNLDLYEHNVRILINKYGADEACKDGSRFFFPCVEVVESHGGELVKVMPLPVAAKKNNTRYGLRSSSKIVVNIPAEGSRNKACFAQACRMFDDRIDHGMIFDTLRAMSNGLSERELSNIFNSAKRKTGN